MSGSQHIQEGSGAQRLTAGLPGKMFGHGMQGGAAKLLVRRKGAGIPEDLGRGSAMAERIDWYRTTLLNLVIQASFLLTVATCRCAHLPR